MKNYIFIIAVTLSLWCTAQTSEMLDTTWYLHNLEIDNVDYSPPVNSDISSIQSVFSNELMETGICSGANAEITAFDNMAFNIGGIFFIELECNEQESNNYEGLYFFDFYLADTGDNLFAYEIVDGQDSPRTLVVTNENGDRAFYGNTILSVDDFDANIFKMFPNPVTSSLQLESSATIKEVRFYNVSGKLVLEENANGLNPTIILEQLLSGVYFVEVASDDGLVEVQKLIKE